TQRCVITALESAHKRSKMIGILGREGMGKSSSISKYLNEHENVFYIRIGQSYRIPNLLDEMIFQTSGSYPSPNTLFTKTKLLSMLLTKTRTKKIMIIDDAGKISPRGLGFFHELRENTIHNTSFVFVGLPYFQKHLINAKKLGVTGVAEFYRRIESWYTIPGLKASEMVAYGLKHGLSQEQCEELKNSGPETIAELENTTEKILEMNELEQEQQIKNVEQKKKPLNKYVKSKDKKTKTSSSL
ncbi:MAG: ATP-binding protein, partial [Cyclobacteriaceae bacterium]|nr:ATP-binding protein [Cyclobacteriaceae bacterium]